MIKKLVVTISIVLASLLSLHEVSSAQSSGLTQAWRETPVFSANPTRLSSTELNEAIGWPITKVYLVKDGTTYLVLYRTDIMSGRIASIYYEVQRENGKGEFNFYLSNIVGAYWARLAEPPSRSQEESADLWKPIRGAPASGYLMRVDSNNLVNLVLVYPNTGGKSQETEVVYPLNVEAESTEGLVASVLPPK